ncbi:fructosamine deglycase FrlB [Mariniluteicoccus endophyticus]
MSEEPRTAPGQGVVGMQPTMESDVREAASGQTLKDVRAFVREALRPTTKVIYLVGCGGSLFMFSAMRFLLEQSEIPTVVLNSQEFVARAPRLVGPDSIVIASSTFGGTQETAGAIEWAQSKGAPVLLVSALADSVCGRAAETVVSHTGVEAKQVLLAVIAYELLAAQGVCPDAQKRIAGLAASGAAFREVNEAFDEKFKSAAKAISDQGCVYVLASGPNEGAAQTFAACYLQEMQNQDAVAIGANDFLHGTFEVIDGKTPVVMFVGEDQTEDIARRAKTFLDRYNPESQIFDSRDFPLTGVAAEDRAVVGSLIYNSSLIARLAQCVEETSGRPLLGRRYMWKVEY